jgi:hypothetical protein
MNERIGVAFRHSYFEVRDNGFLCVLKTIKLSNLMQGTPNLTLKRKKVKMCGEVEISPPKP